MLSSSLSVYHENKILRGRQRVALSADADEDTSLSSV